MKSILAAVSVVLAAALSVSAALPPELDARARDALRRGADWLAALQQPDGHWDMPETPALSALAFLALHRVDAEGYAGAVDRGASFVLSNVQPDGAIWHRPVPGERGGGLANYNTAVCLSSLFALGRPELVPVVQKARAFLAASQYLDDGPFRGGIGYSPDDPRPHADLSNSHLVYEAMRLTESVEDLRAAGEARVDLDWDAALSFLAQLQNYPPVNTNSWVSPAPEDQGGFIYRPAAVGAQPPARPAFGQGQPPAGPRPEGPAPERRELLEQGRALPPPERPAPAAAPGPVVVHPYGSMTYAGILSLVYAKVAPDDPRLAAARDWTQRHWTLDENPGMGPEGLYYFYTTLVKCLEALGDETVTAADGTTVPWRVAVAEKLLSLQALDGSWCNDNNRWWEADPILVTSYSLLALSAAAR